MQCSPSLSHVTVPQQIPLPLMPQVRPVVVRAKLGRRCGIPNFEQSARPHVGRRSPGVEAEDCQRTQLARE